jgi:hypothetical protein
MRDTERKERKETNNNQTNKENRRIKEEGTKDRNVAKNTGKK